MLFKKILNISGSIIECGVANGNSLMLYAYMSELLEPFAINRKIVGFDTFEGFRSISSDKDPKDISNKDFEVFASVLICKDEEELRRQFILINNTKPLSKSLIYELLPQVSDMPERMNSRTLAAKLTSRLNYDTTTSLYLDIDFSHPGT